MLEPILTTAPPTWRAKDVGGNDTYAITRIPTVVSGAQGHEKRDLTGRTRFVYPGSGHEDA